MLGKRTSYIAPAIGILVAVFLVFMLGVMIVLFPIGFMARVVIILGGLLVVGAFAGTAGRAYTGWEERVGFVWLMTVVMLLVLWPRYLYFKVGPGPSVNALTLSLLGLLVYTVGALMRRREIRARFRANSRDCRSLLISVLLFFGFRFLSLPFSDWWLAGTIDVLREMSFLLAVLLATLAFTGREGQERVLVVVLLCATALAVTAGFVELRLRHNLFQSIVDIDTSSSEAVNLARSVVQKFRGGAYRVQSTFDHPIVMGQFLAMMFCLVGVSAVMFDRGVRALSLILLPGIVVMIAKSGSRSGLLGLAVGVGLMCVLVLGLRIFRQGNRGVAEVWWFFVISAASFLALAFFANTFSEVFDSLLQMDRKSTEARLKFLGYAWPAIMESPLVGYGVGMAAVKAGLAGGDGYLTFDNYYLSVTLDYGIPALIAYILMLASPIWQAKRALGGDFKQGLIMMSLVVAILVFALIQSIVSIPNNQSVVIVLGITLMQLSARVKSSRRGESSHGS
jgi:hypothetical protein